jgi:hypothetical protein
LPELIYHEIILLREYQASIGYRARLPAGREGRNRVVSSQESQGIAQTLSQVPQGTLAWDPEYAEYLRWLAEQGKQA